MPLSITVYSHLVTSYDQWPTNWEIIIRDCGVSCCQEEFYAFGQQADEAARRLIVALLYLDSICLQGIFNAYESGAHHVAIARTTQEPL